MDLLQHQVSVLIESVIDGFGDFRVPVDQIVEMRRERLDVHVERLRIELVVLLVVLLERHRDVLRVNDHIR